MEHSAHQKTTHHHSGHDHSELIELLLRCARTCEMCASACLDEQDVRAMSHCIELDRDCADICMLNARLLMRDSEFAHQLLAVCEAVCRHCADECGKHQHEHCRRCAEVCRQCAEACHAHHGAVNLK